MDNEYRGDSDLTTTEKQAEGLNGYLEHFKLCDRLETLASCSRDTCLKVSISLELCKRCPSNRVYANEEFKKNNALAYSTGKRLSPKSCYPVVQF